MKKQTPATVEKMVRTRLSRKMSVARITEELNNSATVRNTGRSYTVNQVAGIVGGIRRYG